MDPVSNRSVVSVVLEWLQSVPRSLSAEELREWGGFSEFAESPQWDSAFGPLNEASVFEIVEQMADINEALSSAIRVRDRGFDWYIEESDGYHDVESRKVDRREAEIMVEVFTSRLEVLSGHLGVHFQSTVCW